MKRKYKILILAIFFTLSFIAYQTITHKTEITKFIVKTILEHKQENAFEFANKFVSVVPNYGIDDGFEIVSKEDYEKYQQGFCLAENRILDKEELYKRAIKEYLNKKIEIWKGVRTRQILDYGYNIDIKKIENIGYYVSNFFGNLDWYEFLIENFDENKTYIEITNAKKVDNPMDYIIFDFDNDVIGFSKPVIFNNYSNNDLYLDKGFILEKNTIIDNYISLSDKQRITEHGRWLYNSKIKKKTLAFRNKIDNCGNVEKNTQQAINNTVLAIVQGG
ncbi:MULTISPECIES: hypothetical protein [unclassified Campylobacter]|uniref:hypothetical protein n=1 Tax=unclassified Campylobacter TaxID=2593542 RepID=UPI0022E9DB93|nr:MULTISPECIES: hypothetical protein [unclassified Campylobacter]MDA3055279.1 hypothetical protein [Campylobacter sp. VBCF_07 NA4]MDA3061531.1 hypothetical protein [Campylobacter sp. VBCF_02 NA5]MDA3071048.1 hypothetical protein [Campylobacter sp. VBCF_08 NA3]WBR53980.1 hypothetical protein PF027_06550 [Campylobacter sp. VBCF_01 NA2]